MGWKDADFGAGFARFKEPAELVKVATEVVASMLFIMVATAGGANVWSWGVSFVVVGCVFAGCHINSWITFYKMFCGKMCPVQAIFYIGAQMLGAFLAGQLSGALGMAVDDVSGTAFAIDDWKSGLQEFITVAFFLWCFAHANSDRFAGDMPKNLFVLFAVAVAFMFNADTVFTFSRCFAGMDAIKACGPSLLWGAVACVMTHVKMVLMGFEDKWLWESNDDVQHSDEQEAPIADDA